MSARKKGVARAYFDACVARGMGFKESKKELKIAHPSQSTSPLSNDILKQLFNAAAAANAAADAAAAAASHRPGGKGGGSRSSSGGGGSRSARRGGRAKMRVRQPPSEICANLDAARQALHDEDAAVTVAAIQGRVAEMFGMQSQEQAWMQSEAAHNIPTVEEVTRFGQQIDLIVYASVRHDRFSSFVTVKELVGTICRELGVLRYSLLRMGSILRRQSIIENFSPPKDMVKPPNITSGDAIAAVSKLMDRRRRSRVRMNNCDIVKRLAQDHGVEPKELCIRVTNRLGFVIKTVADMKRVERARFDAARDQEARRMQAELSAKRDEKRVEIFKAAATDREKLLQRASDNVGEFMMDVGKLIEDAPTDAVALEWIQDWLNIGVALGGGSSTKLTAAKRRRSTRKSAAVATELTTPYAHRIKAETFFMTYIAKNPGSRRENPAASFGAAKKAMLADSPELREIPYKSCKKLYQAAQAQTHATTSQQSHVVGVSVVDTNGAECGAGSKVYIKNLNKEEIDDDDLAEVFSRFGIVTSCRIVIDSQTGESLGFAFIHFEEEEAAQHAIATLDGNIICGQIVHLGINNYEVDIMEEGTKQWANIDGPGAPFLVVELGVLAFSGGTFVGEVSGGKHWSQDKHSSSTQTQSCLSFAQKGHDIVFSEKQAFGHGIFTWPDASRYDGEFSNNKRHGHGLRVYNDGQRYIGEWYANKRAGLGVHTWPTGEKYDGHYKNDQRHGYGMMEGNGIMYRGDWFKNKKHGFGLMTLSNGMEYDGEFRDDKVVSGEGMLTFPGGRFYEGAFCEASLRPHGQGTMTFPSGKTQVGMWEQGEFVEKKKAAKKPAIELAAEEAHAQDLHALHAAAWKRIEADIATRWPARKIAPMLYKMLIHRARYGSTGGASDSGGASFGIHDADVVEQIDLALDDVTAAAIDKPGQLSAASALLKLCGLVEEKLSAETFGSIGKGSFLRFVSAQSKSNDQLRGRINTFVGAATSTTSLELNPPAALKRALSDEARFSPARGGSADGDEHGTLSGGDREVTRSELVAFVRGKVVDAAAHLVTKRDQQEIAGRGGDSAIAVRVLRAVALAEKECCEEYRIACIEVLDQGTMLELLLDKADGNDSTNAPNSDGALDALCVGGMSGTADRWQLLRLLQSCLEQDPSISSMDRAIANFFASENTESLGYGTIESLTMAAARVATSGAADVTTNVRTAVELLLLPAKNSDETDAFVATTAMSELVSSEGRARTVILNLPLLCDIGATLSWTHVFAPKLGALGAFLHNWSLEDERVAAFVEVNFNTFVRVDPTPSYDKLDAATKTPRAMSPVQRSMEAAANDVAAQLVSLAVSYGGVEGAFGTMGDLLKDHLRRSFERHPSPADFAMLIIIAIPHSLRPAFSERLLALLPPGVDTAAAQVLHAAIAQNNNRARVVLHQVALSVGRPTEWLENFKSFALHREQAMVADTVDADSVDIDSLGEHTGIGTSAASGSASPSEPVVVASKSASKDGPSGIDADRDVDSETSPQAMEAKRVVEEISSYYEDMPRRTKQTVTNMLKLLAGDLYSKKTHFIAELVQNADDNRYGDDVTPSVLFEVHAHSIRVRNNERGFSKTDIISLTDAGNSSKKTKRKANGAGYIGQKGIGFKSVFKITDVASVHSNGLHIKFDKVRHKELGYVWPDWIDDKRLWPDDAWMTTIDLPLIEKQHELTERLSDIRPEIMLFLQQLRSISIDDRVSGVRRDMLRTDAEGDCVIELKESIVSDEPEISDEHKIERWLVQRKIVAPGDVRRTEGTDPIQATEVAIAFPMGSWAIDIADSVDLADPYAEAYANDLSQQDVFAFLPVSSYGFKFVLQGDWLVPSSRELVDKSKVWNQMLSCNVSDLFISSLELFKTHADLAPPVLAAAFLSFVPLPKEVTGLFEKAAEEMRKKVRLAYCIATSCNKWVMPSEAVTLPPKLAVRKKRNLMALVDADRLWKTKGLRFAHLEFVSRLPRRNLETMKLRQLDHKLLLEVLRSEVRLADGNYADPRCACTIWMIYQLLSLLRDSVGKSKFVEARTEVYAELGKLPMLPTLNGLIVAASDAAGVYILATRPGSLTERSRVFHDELRILDPTFIETLHDQDLVKSLATPEESRDQELVLRKVLSEIGVKTLSRREIVERHIVGTVYKHATPSENEKVRASTYLVYVMGYLVDECKLGLRKNGDDVVSVCEHQLDLERITSSGKDLLKRLLDSTHSAFLPIATDAGANDVARAVGGDMPLHLGDEVTFRSKDATDSVNIGALCKEIGHPWLCVDVDKINSSVRELYPTYATKMLRFVQPFLLHLGVTELFAIETRSFRNVQQGECVVDVEGKSWAWNRDSMQNALPLWDQSGGVMMKYNVNDFTSPEMCSVFTACVNALRDDSDPPPGCNVLKWLEDQRTSDGFDWLTVTTEVAGGSATEEDADAVASRRESIDSVIAGKIVHTIYTGTPYEVTEVDWSSNANSLLDTLATRTFAQYYREKYGLVLMSNRPMLIAKPRGVGNSGKTVKLPSDHVTFQDGIKATGSIAGYLSGIALALDCQWKLHGSLWPYRSANIKFNDLYARRRTDLPDIAEVPSSFVHQLQSLCWLPAEDPWDMTTSSSREATVHLFPPSEIYLQSPQMKELLGENQVRFTIPKLSMQFANRIGVKVSTTPATIVDLLKKWSGLPEFTTSVKHMKAVYTHLLSSSKSRTGESELFGKHQRLIWVPDHSVIDPSMSRDEWEAKQHNGTFFATYQLCWKDTTDRVDRYQGMGKQSVRTLQNVYKRSGKGGGSSMLNFKTEFGDLLRDEPTTEQLAASLQTAIGRQFLKDDHDEWEAVSDSKVDGSVGRAMPILKELNRRLRVGEGGDVGQSTEDALRSLAYNLNPRFVPVVCSRGSKWVRPAFIARTPIFVDTSVTRLKLSELFRNDICILAPMAEYVSVRALLSNFCGVVELGNFVTSAPLLTGVGDPKWEIFTRLLHAASHAQRWLFFKARLEYDRLAEERRLPEQLASLSITQCDSIEMMYTLEHEHLPAPFMHAVKQCALLQDNEVSGATLNLAQLLSVDDDDDDDAEEDFEEAAFHQLALLFLPHKKNASKCRDLGQFLRSLPCEVTPEGHINDKLVKAALKRQGLNRKKQRTEDLTAWFPQTTLEQRFRDVALKPEHVSRQSSFTGGGDGDVSSDSEDDISAEDLEQAQKAKEEKRKAKAAARAKRAAEGKEEPAGSLQVPVWPPRPTSSALNVQPTSEPTPRGGVMVEVEVEVRSHTSDDSGAAAACAAWGNIQLMQRELLALKKVSDSSSSSRTIEEVEKCKTRIATLDRELVDAMRAMQGHVLAVAQQSVVDIASVRGSTDVTAAGNAVGKITFDIVRTSAFADLANGDSSDAVREIAVSIERSLNNSIAEANAIIGAQAVAAPHSAAGGAAAATAAGRHDELEHIVGAGVALGFDFTRRGVGSAEPSHSVDVEIAEACQASWAESGRIERIQSSAANVGGECAATTVVGEIGERVALEIMRRELERAGGGGRVEWVNESTEQGKPYDLAIYDSPDSSVVTRFVEVKSTKQQQKSAFEASLPELRWALSHRVDVTVELLCIWGINPHAVNPVADAKYRRITNLGEKLKGGSIKMLLDLKDLILDHDGDGP